MDQKARMGGTPGKAPMGYLNVPATAPDGSEYRTVAIDHERAPHIRWAFRTYATGRYNLDEIVEMLDSRGFKTKPRKRGGPLVPIGKGALGRLFRNPYYIGKLVYKGEILDEANHEPLVSEELFDRVQQLLTAKNTSGTRRRVHRHPLKGMLRCGHCDTRMYFSLIRNRHGSEYRYFRCKGRQDRHCEMSYVGYEDVLDKVQQIHHRQSRITDEERELLGQWIEASVEEMSKDSVELRARTEQELEKLHNQRAKLLELHYDDIIDKDTFRTEQERIDKQERQARLRLAEATSGIEEATETIDKAIVLLQTWPDRMTEASPKLQDSFHEVFYRHFEVTEADTGDSAGRGLITVLDQPQEHTTALMGALRAAGDALTGC